MFYPHFDSGLLWNSELFRLGILVPFGYNTPCLLQLYYKCESIKEKCSYCHV